ncbi:hypothetical protein [Pseudomonas sp. B21-035]|uniref:hypothetical protein n=1 Tax=Pseudomonas sp. B21-035 TaxID=2895484 RepID=UPI00215F6BFB|nr:hypothetical protein [Pseudomonas sp. B21-035]UVL58888.1 hypothetical protein LOY22_13210 [Pseudomonas sp. B21-035]
MAKSFIARLYGKVDSNHHSRIPVTLSKFVREVDFYNNVKYKVVNDDWLNLNYRDTTPVELRFEHQYTNNKYRIIIDSGAFEGYTMGVGESGPTLDMVGAWNKVSSTDPTTFFEISYDGNIVTGDQLPDTAGSIKILNNNRNALKWRRRPDENPNDFEYPNFNYQIVDGGDNNLVLEFYLEITKRFG